MLQITMDGKSKKLFKQLQQFDTVGRKAIKKGIKDGFELLGIDLVKKTAQAIKNPPKTGRIYKYLGRDHQASAHGQAPANRSGRLMSEVMYKARGDELTFGYTTPYGKFLELGTANMDMRPNIFPRGFESQRNATKYMEKTIPKAIRKGLK